MFLQCAIKARLLWNCHYETVSFNPD